MIRRIITINEERCNGCGLCADACHERAIGIVDGKAKLLREDYCDGLGDCLPACPMNAISFEEREAPAYDEAAVLAAKKSNATAPSPGCPGAACRSMDCSNRCANQLRNFPIQMKLVPTNAPYFDGVDLLIAADCTAYSYGNFHNHFMKNRVTLIGCPKLDGADYSEKLAQILRNNNIRSVTVTRMTVPCCGGLSYMVSKAVEMSGKNIPLHIVTISPNGQIVK
ncbi:MAG: 4Fe-4S binding protein [Oscillospiraceae bacterium]|nr:4Fe-4S binding protein [Oscillospiraceae bacterium]